MTKSRFLLTLLSTTVIISGSAFAATTVANPTAPVTRGEFQELLRQTLLENPNILMEVAEKMQEAQDQEMNKKSQEAILKYKKEIFSDPDAPTLGAADADVTVVEFFDYHCGYCKQALASISKLIESDKKVKVVFKEYPILSEDSHYAAKAALSVYRIDKAKYFDFHKAMFGLSGTITESVVVREATRLGIDTEKLKAEIAKPEIEKIIARDRELGNNIGVRGTPAIIIGDKLYPGAVPLEVMQKAIAEQRAAKK